MTFYWDNEKKLEVNLAEAARSFFELGEMIGSSIEENTKQLRLLRRAVAGPTVAENNTASTAPPPDQVLADVGGLQSLMSSGDSICRVLKELQEELSATLKSEMLQALVEDNGRLQVEVAELKKKLGERS